MGGADRLGYSLEDSGSQRSYLVGRLLEAALTWYRLANLCARDGRDLSAAKWETVGFGLLEAAGRVSTVDFEADTGGVFAPALVDKLERVANSLGRDIERDRGVYAWHAVEQWELTLVEVVRLLEVVAPAAVAS